VEKKGAVQRRNVEEKEGAELQHRERKKEKKEKRRLKIPFFFTKKS
jgi:hypothetical protein